MEMQAHEGHPKLTKKNMKKLNKVRCADWTDAKWQHRQTVREKIHKEQKTQTSKLYVEYVSLLAVFSDAMSSFPSHSFRSSLLENKCTKQPVRFHGEREVPAAAFLRVEHYFRQEYSRTLDHAY